MVQFLNIVYFLIPLNLGYGETVNCFFTHIVGRLQGDELEDVVQLNSMDLMSIQT